MTSAVPLGRSGAERELSHVTDDSKNNAFSMKLQEKLWTLKLIALVVGNQVCMFGECAVSEDMEACPWGSPTPHPWVSSFDWSSFVSFMKKKKGNSRYITFLCSWSHSSESSNLGEW